MVCCEYERGVSALLIPNLGVPYAGDTDALALWERFRALSIDEYRRIYGQLHIGFDVYDGESQVWKRIEERETWLLVSWQPFFSTGAPG